MVAISDNTAADLLATTVGRPAVEAAVTALAPRTRPGSCPSPTTREVFTLGWGAPELLERWAGADVEERRDLLAQLPPDLGGVEAADVTTPVWSRGVGWSASAEDVCRAHLGLQQLAGQPGLEPVREVLAENPGLPLDDEVWDYAAFEGGSAPGVLAASWYLERADGEDFVLVAQAADADAAVDQPLLFAVVQDAVELLADDDG